MKRFTRAIIAMVAGLALTGSAVADSTVPMQGTGAGHAISQNQIQSTGQIRVGRNDYAVVSTVTILSLAPGPGHTLQGTTTHTIDFGGGDSVTTMDEARLVPVDDLGNFQLLIKCEIVSGTGNLAGASGDITFTGRANLATGTAEWRLHGSLRGN